MGVKKLLGMDLVNFLEAMGYRTDIFYISPDNSRIDLRVYKKKFLVNGSLNGLCIISVDNKLRHATLCIRKRSFKLQVLLMIRKIKKRYMIRCLIAKNYPLDWETSEKVIKKGLEHLVAPGLQL